MKSKFLVLILAGMFTVLLAGAQTTTYILLRHAEKDTTAQGSTMMQADPPLSQAGLARAARIPEVLKGYTPDAIWSTNYNRTKSTVGPLAKLFGKEIQVYDPRNLKAFAETLLKEQDKTIVVAGHSNSTPTLVNLLIGENKYANLDESVYNQLWIVTIKDGKASARIVQY